MRGTLHVTTDAGLATGSAPSRFVVRAVLTDCTPREVMLGRHRADIVARAFEDALNATNLEVVSGYMRHHKGGNIDGVDAARILDAAGVRP